MPRLTFQLLGTPRIELDGSPIEVDTRKAIALAIYLAMSGEAHSRERLATFFWPEADEAKAHAALRRTLSVLNKALGGEALKIDRELVVLERGPAIWVDVDEFHRRLADCQTHGHPPHDPCPHCLQPLSQAAALYHDDFLSGFTLRDSPAFDDWQFFQSEELRRELAGALERLSKCHDATGDAEAAIAQTRRWLALDPMHEPAHRQLMSLYARAGQRAAALRQYQECVRILDEELGVPPLEETTRLYETIKEKRSEGTREQENRGKRETAPSPPGPQPALPLVGRARERDDLIRHYNAPGANGALIVIEGEAGIGKTRLAEAFLEGVQAQGGTALAARCYEGELNLAYGPFLEALRPVLRQPAMTARLERIEPHWLAEAARLLPELAELRPGLPPAPALDSPGARSRFFESIAQVLLALGNSLPTVVFLDDVHWIDESSLDLLTYLARRLRGHRLCLLVAWRSEQVLAGHRLRQLLAEAGRAGLARALALSRLDQAAVAELIQSALKSAPASRIAERLYHESEGLPLFVVEYLASLSRGEAEADWPLPAGVRGLLQSRFRSVDEAGKQLLSTAAVIGRSFDFDTLQVASGRTDEETVGGLEALIAQGLVHAERVSGDEEKLIYDFSHDKLRTLVYDETSLARRRLLHRRVAEALATRARSQTPPGPLASQIALHYQLGGRNVEAAHHYKLAGDHARALYANAEALAHLLSALALGYPDSSSLHEAIGDLQTLAGDYSAALGSYQAAAATGAPDALARLEHKLANVYDRWGEWELAESHFRAALDHTGLQRPVRPEGERARLYADWSRAAHHGGQTGQAAELAHQSLELAKAADDARGLAQAYNILGLIASHEDNFAQARAYLEQSLALAEALNDPDARIAALNNLALACRETDDLPRALALTQQALTLCASLGDRHRVAALHNNLADLHHAQSNEAEAMHHLTQAAALFAEIGVEADVGASKWQPEVWKLTEW